MNSTQEKPMFDKKDPEYGKEEVLGLKVFDKVILKDKTTNEPLAEVQLIEKNEDREKRGLRAIKTRYKVVSPTESFWSKIFEGRTIVGMLNDQDNFEVEVSGTGEDGVIEQVIRINS